MPAFPDVPRIKYEGPDSTNPLAYRHYNPDEMGAGQQPGEEDQAVYIDGNIITSRTPEDLPAFVVALMEMMRKA